MNMKYPFSSALLCMALLYSCSPGKEKQGSVNTDTIISIDASKAQISDKNGLEIKYYDNGVIKIKGAYLLGKREGQWVSFYKNGHPWSEDTYKEGLKDGPTTAWFENGEKRYEGFYTKETKTGKWSFWNEKGELAKEINF